MSTDSGQGSSGANTNAGGEGNQDNQLPEGGSYPKEFVEKLKKEKMNARAEADRLKKELEDKNAQELEKAGKLNELVELERTRAKESDEKAKNLSNTIIKRSVLSAAQEVAKAEGAQYFEVIEKLIDVSKIEVNPETLEVDQNGIKAQIQGIKSRMPGLFVTSPPRTNDLPPGGAPNIQSKSLDQLSKDELIKLYRTKI